MLVTHHISEKPQLAIKKSRYNSFKMNIKLQNMCQTCLLVFVTEVCAFLLFSESS